jgi:NAD(P)H-dependent FMN reductase
MKILLLPGSRRQNSINVMLLQAVAKRLSAFGVEVDFVGPDDLNAPIYDGDYETDVGIPEDIKRLNTRMNDADGIVVASPEYNGFFSPLLKNTLDWMSRAEDGQLGKQVFIDKPALVLAAAPGPMAAARALPHIRTQLSNLGLNVYRAQLGVGRANTVFGKEGDVVGIVDEHVNQQVDELVDGFVGFAKKLAR